MLVSLGLDFNRADVGTRESFHLTDAEVEGAYVRDTENHGVREFLVLNTCNRVELYGWLEASPRSLRSPHRYLALRYFGDDVEAQRFIASSSPKIGRSAVEHLFRVASGLESQILGDIHIQGQVRRAYRHATESGTMGPHLHRLFDVALKTGKAVKRETELMSGRSSVGSEAVALAERRLGGLAGRRCAIVGCGKIGSHAAQSLQKLGADLVLLNRSPGRAERLQRQMGGTIGDWSRLHAEVAASEVVIVATGARTPVIQRDALLPERTGADPQLLIVDIGMPRNVEPSIAGLPNTMLVDLDELHPEAAFVARSRDDAVPYAQDIVGAHVDEYMAWQTSQGAKEALRPLRENLHEICLREIRYAARQGGSETDMERAANRIVSKLLARPMTVLRDTDRDQDVEVVHGAMRLIFENERMQELAASQDLATRQDLAPQTNLEAASG